MGFATVGTSWAFTSVRTSWVKDIYDNPTFAVIENNTVSDEYKQHTGIRQGCPLSPYLFIIFLTVLMHDVRASVRQQCEQQHIHNPFHVHSANHPLLDIAYADDILLLSRNTHILQMVFNTLETEAARYNMQLNKKKTYILHYRHMNVKDDKAHTIYFATNTPADTEAVPTANAIKYLGITINNKGTLKSHLKPISYTRKQFGTLQNLWSHTNIEAKFKLKIYKAIFNPMAVYALHYDWHTDATNKYMDGWHIKLLRRTMRWKTT